MNTKPPRPVPKALRSSSPLIHYIENKFLREDANKLHSELLVAAARGDVKAIRSAVKRGADPNWIGYYDHSAPLFAASMGGTFGRPSGFKASHSATKALLDAGSNPNRLYSDGSNALHYVLNASIADLLIARGTEVNLQNMMGNTPLNELLYEGEAFGEPQNYARLAGSVENVVL